jgi:hypothetical protein
VEIIKMLIGKIMLNGQEVPFKCIGNRVIIDNSFIGAGTFTFSYSKTDDFTEANGWHKTKEPTIKDLTKQKTIERKRAILGPKQSRWR